ncbi:peptidoglycan -binding protein [Acetobacter sp. TBRC 12305]|uniref:Peptidoglycan -binding protein n=1 Tax=Acetobacter garciniae TaxID=2817435 RepID=A0A939HRC7_9PROT|nr:peptidoglycan -binding protein [Acetobacter garciniae]MBO1326782.1 peptidoglycan -binding protein [Acetobacter garciniae]MBX0345917.1 peptidoglycan -binding protein [Acetobacter garciniae]
MRPGRRGRTSHAGLNAWPGYVDALSTLLMVVTFVLLVFVLGQAFLSVALNRREHVLDRLQVQAAELTRMLALERGLTKDLRGNLAVLTEQHNKDTAAATALGNQLAAAQAAAVHANELDQTAEEKVSSLNDQLSALNAQLTAISQALDVSKKDVMERDAKIADLGNRLNIALADKVEQLKRYRSEFFGRLRDVLKDQKGVQIVGDRFVFQSEVLFPVGSADLTPQGVAEIRTLAKTFRQVSSQIPADVPWILRVDGHADRQPIHTAFPSNWELSSARAITVVKLLIAEGVDPKHLAATGFADYQPLSQGTSVADFARNRRIEFRLTDR